MVRKYANDDGLGEGIGDVFEDDVAPEKTIETLGIREPSR